jgi:hypothetical protein
MDDKYVENEFDRFMAELSYTRVSEDIGDSPSFQNADYVNKTDKSVVELKVLQKEFFDNGGLVDSLNAIIINPVNIDDRGIGQYVFTIPNINREGKYDNFEEPLRRVIKKANSQLRETREYYFENEISWGFLMLAQVGFNQLSPDITAALVQKIVNREFRSIDGVIICTPYHRTRNPTTLKINPECVSVTNELDIIKKKKCMDIADKWVKFLEKGGHIAKL